MSAGTPIDASRARRRALQLALVGVALVWGVTFPVVKDAVSKIPPFEFLAIRFTIAAGLMTGASARSFRSLGRRGLVAGLAAGAVLAAGYAFQTIGLQYTTASNAGFITGLFVVFTPLLGAAVLRRVPSRWALDGVVLATVGLVLLSFRGGEVRFRYGDALVLLCAVSFAVHILILGRVSPRFPTAPLTAVQLWVAAIASAIASLAAEPVIVPRSGSVWIAIGVTAVFASAAAFYIQTLAQRYLDPTRVALTLVSEPAFAGLFSYLILGETLSALGWIGAALILAGMVTAELGAAYAERARAP